MKNRLLLKKTGYTVLLLATIGVPPLFAQKKASALEKTAQKYQLKPIVAMQIWTSYSMGERLFNENTQQYEAVDNRLNTQLRRSRFGVKGKLHEQLTFNCTAAFDLVGRDVLSATQGGFNNGGSPKLRLWNANFLWKINPQNEHLNFSFGYQLPQIGRESITGALRVSSLEKAWSQNYLRRQITGTGPGRAMGMNLGGLFGKKGEKVGFRYDLGVFSPLYEALSGNSYGRKAAPLVVVRAVLMLGEAESESYSLSHKTNYFGTRNRLSIALSGAMQNATDLFEKNYVAGGDWLFNWGALTLDGDWHWLYREGKDAMEGNTFSVPAQTGYARVAYCLPLKNGRYFEPSLMWTALIGATDATQQAQGQQVSAFTGKDKSVAFALNYHFSKKLKCTLAYTIQSGDLGAVEIGSGINNYFYQSGAGAIERGDWLGIGFVGVF